MSELYSQRCAEAEADGQMPGPSLLDNLNNVLHDEAPADEAVWDVSNEALQKKYDEKPTQKLRESLENLRKNGKFLKTNDGGANIAREMRHLEMEIARRDREKQSEETDQSKRWLRESLQAQEHRHAGSPEDLTEDHRCREMARAEELKRTRQGFGDLDQPSQPKRVKHGSHGEKMLQASKASSGTGRIPLPLARVNPQPISALPARNNIRLGGLSGPVGRCGGCGKNDVPTSELKTLDVKNAGKDRAQLFCRACRNNLTGTAQDQSNGAVQGNYFVLPKVKEGMGSQQRADVQPSKARQVGWYGDDSLARASRRSGRQKILNPQKAVQEEEPIEIGSDDEEEDPAKASGSDTEFLGVNTRRASTRSTRFVTTSQRYAGLSIIYPPNDRLGSVEVNAVDLSRLDTDEFLNDTVIDFYIKYIQQQLPAAQAQRFHFFNSFFYKKLTEKPAGGAGGEQSNHSRVKRWTKGQDIFARDYIFLPIHDHLHWSLVVICHPGSERPWILHLDSLVDGGHQLGSVTRPLRDYLSHEWERKISEGGDSVPVSWQRDHPGEDRKFDADTVKGHRVKTLPAQDNHCDCGLFVLAYMEYFTFAAPARLDFEDVKKEVVAGGDYPGFLTKQWFKPDNASALRKHIRMIIFREFLAQAEPGHQLMEEVRAAIRAYDAEGQGYFSPSAYKPFAAEEWQRYLQREEKRKQEAEARKKAREEEAVQKRADKAAKDAEVKRLAGQRAAERAQQRQQDASKKDPFAFEEQFDMDLELEGSPAKAEPRTPPKAMPAAEAGAPSMEQLLAGDAGPVSQDFGDTISILSDGGVRGEDTARPDAVLAGVATAEQQPAATPQRQQQLVPDYKSSSSREPEGDDDETSSQDIPVPPLINRHEPPREPVRAESAARNAPADDGGSAAASSEGPTPARGTASEQPAVDQADVLRSSGNPSSSSQPDGREQPTGGLDLAHQAAASPSRGSGAPAGSASSPPSAVAERRIRGHIVQNMANTANNLIQGLNHAAGALGNVLRRSPRKAAAAAPAPTLTQSPAGSSRAATSTAPSEASPASTAPAASPGMGLPMHSAFMNSSSPAQPPAHTPVAPPAESRGTAQPVGSSGGARPAARFGISQAAISGQPSCSDLTDKDIWDMEDFERPTSEVDKEEGGVSSPSDDSSDREQPGSPDGIAQLRQEARPGSSGRSGGGGTPAGLSPAAGGSGPPSQRGAAAGEAGRAGAWGAVPETSGKPEETRAVPPLGIQRMQGFLKPQPLQQQQHQAAAPRRTNLKKKATGSKFGLLSGPAIPGPAVPGLSGVPEEEGSGQSHTVRSPDPHGQGLSMKQRVQNAAAKQAPAPPAGSEEVVDLISDDGAISSDKEGTDGEEPSLSQKMGKLGVSEPADVGPQAQKGGKKRLKNKKWNKKQRKRAKS